MLYISLHIAELEWLGICLNISAQYCQIGLHGFKQRLLNSMGTLLPSEFFLEAAGGQRRGHGGSCPLSSLALPMLNRPTKAKISCVSGFRPSPVRLQCIIFTLVFMGILFSVSVCFYELLCRPNTTRITCRKININKSCIEPFLPGLSSVTLSVCNGCIGLLWLNGAR